MLIDKVIPLLMHRLLAGGGETAEDVGHFGDSPHSSSEEEHSSFGVHITYQDLYASIIFFTCIYLAGWVASRLLKMPALVGEIFAGILLGPPVADYVPNPEAFVMLGEIGLILLVLEAGIDIDLTTLKLIGVRGVVIAIIGSILPIGIGIGIAFALGTDVKGSIAAGCTFGPTSLGVAMNILRSAKIINTPIGQLIVAAAIIDDMIALIILSQLNALVGEITVVGIIVPIISAIAFLLLGGALAIWVLPGWLDKYLFQKFDQSKKGPMSLGIMILILLAMMPATYYAQTSYLMGAFLSGLVFCSNHEAHMQFVSQFKRLMQWLMRIFFAASIGFQVPIKHFANGTVVWQGLVFTLALLGKLAVGFLVPNFTHHRRFTGHHLRDVMITGFSMAAEGEFAFVIAVFSVDSLLISQDLYASVVLAVLLSTILAPFSLRFTIGYYNKKTQAAIKEAETLEVQRHMKNERSPSNLEAMLKDAIKQNTTIFMCIQTQSASTWGLLPKIMQEMFRLNLEVIDHRSWNPRGVNTTLVNEIYVQDTITCSEKDQETQLEDMIKNRLEEVRAGIFDSVNQPDAKVRVTRWYPGVVEETVEEVDGDDENKTTKRTAKLTVTETILQEASKALDKDMARQTTITKERPIEEIIQESVPLAPEQPAGFGAAGGGGGGGGLDRFASSPNVENGVGTSSSGLGARPRRPRRIKTRSTPVVGGDLFASPQTESQEAPAAVAPLGRGDQMATLTVDGQVYKIRVDNAALSRLRSVESTSAGDSGHGGAGRGGVDSFMLGANEIRAPRRQRQVSYDHMLQGHVRKQPNDFFAPIPE